MTLAPPPTPPAPHQPAIAQIVIDGQPAATRCRFTENGQLPNPPDIIIDGNITALDADLHVTDNTGSIDITAPIIQVDNEYITAKDNLTFDEINFFASGDPAAQLLASELGTPNSLNPISQSQIRAYESAPPQVSDDAQTIEINAEVVDLNGALVAGDATQTLTITQTTALTNEIAEIQKEGLTGLVALNSVSTNDLHRLLQHRRQQPRSRQHCGGRRRHRHTGAVYSTSQASLNAFGYYGSINITNTTNYNLIVNKLDVSTPGAGVINITDLNKRRPTDRAASSTRWRRQYQSEQTGGMKIATQYVDPLTGNILFQNSNGNYVGVNTSTTNANNLPNLTGLTLVTANSPDPQSLTGSSTLPYTLRRRPALHLLGGGIVPDNDYPELSDEQLGSASSASAIPPTTRRRPRSRRRRRSRRQANISTSTPNSYLLFRPAYRSVRASGSSTPGSVQRSRLSLHLDDRPADTTGFQPTANWTTSTWYGKKTYYQTDTEINGDETIVADLIKADLPVTINFTGNTTASISIDSEHQRDAARQPEQRQRLDLDHRGRLHHHAELRATWSKARRFR